MPARAAAILTTLLVALVVLEGSATARVHSDDRRSVAVSVVGVVREPQLGDRRSGARLTGVRAPEARLASFGLGEIVDIGGDIACGVICVGVDLAKKVGGKAGSVVGDVAGDIAQGALDQLAGGIAAGGSWMMRKTAQLIERTTTPVLSARWFQERYDEMRRVAVLFAVLAFLAGVIGAIVSRDGIAMLKLVGIRLPLAFALTAVLCVLVQMAVEIGDAITADFAASFVDNISAAMGSGARSLIAISLATGPQGAAVPAIVTIVVALFAIATAFVLWLELLVRDAGIYVVVFLAPLVCAAMIWERCVALLTRTLWFLFALVLSKPLMVAIMSLAGSGLGSGIGEQGLGVVLPVVVLMLLACLSPWALLALVPLLEGIGAHQGTRRALTGMSVGGAAAAGFGGRQAIQAVMDDHFDRGPASAFGDAQGAGNASVATHTAGAATSGDPAAVAASTAASAGSALRNLPADTAARQAQWGGESGTEGAPAVRDASDAVAAAGTPGPQPPHRSNPTARPPETPGLGGHGSTPEPSITDAAGAADGGGDACDVTTRPGGTTDIAESSPSAGSGPPDVDQPPMPTSGPATEPQQ